MAVDLSAFDALLARAEAQYLQSPAEAVRLVDAALAELGSAAPALLQARALKIKGNAQIYGTQAVAGLATLQSALEALPADATTGEAAELRVDLLRGVCAAHEQMSNLPLALHWALQAAEAARALGQPGRLADTLLSVGVMRSRSGDHANGLAHFEEALLAYEAAQERSQMHGALCNVGIACKNLGRLEDAVLHLQRSAALARELDNDGMLAVSLANLGEPLWKLGRLDEALEATTFAARQLQTSGFANGEAHARILRGQVLQDLGDAAAARAELEQALRVALASGHHVARAHLALATLHKGAGRFEAALEQHEAYHAAERAQFNEESARTLNALQVRFDLARARHEAEVQRLESARLAEQSRTDVLTGLPNRRHLDDHLAVACAAAHHGGQPLALAMIDVDDFKRINDLFGHGVGDAVLGHVAERLRSQCRGANLVARYGGEEFCVVLPGADRATAMALCEAMREAVAGHDWAAVAAGMGVTLSIGLVDAGAGATPQALLAAADARLYTAKREGKNRVV